MKIYLSPQVSDQHITYEFKDKSFTATLNGVVDEFDFNEFQDGRLDVQSVKTELEINPIISAEIKNGELFIELINYIGTNASEEEKFPEWLDSNDLKEGEDHGKDDVADEGRVGETTTGDEETSGDTERSGATHTAP